jgi:hypothetical protein
MAFASGGRQRISEKYEKVLRPAPVSHPTVFEIMNCKRFEESFTLSYNIFNALLRAHLPPLFIRDSVGCMRQ